MESDQIEKRVMWLDEQRRKDNNALNTLMERLTNAEDLIEQQTRQIKDLSSEIARLAGTTTRIRKFDDALTKQREDLIKQIENTFDVINKKETSLEKVRLKDYEGLSKSISELRIELAKIEELKQGIETRRQEEIRINRILDTLDKNVDEVKDQGEEQRRSLN